MARRTGEAATRIYAAAKRFVAEGLERDGSLFTPDQAVWTATVANDLDARFVQRPDPSKDKFEAKFERQLAGAPATTIQFAAELLFVHLLISTQMKFRTKLAIINTVLSWSPTPVSVPDDLASALDGGLCNAGRGFLSYRHALLTFLVGFVQRWKRLDADERGVTISDPWAFKRFVFAEPAFAAQSQQHALLHLVFPEVFESIVSTDHKARIVETFRQFASNAGEDEDRRLLAIRAGLAPKYGPSFNFWERDIKAQWLPAEEEEEEPEAVVRDEPVGQRYWVEKTLVADRPDRLTGEHALGRALWSPQKDEGGRDIYRSMQEVKPGDLVLHFVDNRHFSGISEVLSPPDESFVGLAGTKWAGRPALRLQLANYTPLTPPLEREDFLGSQAVAPRLHELLDAHRGMFFNRELQLNQGSYLTEAPRALVNLLNDVYREKTGKDLPLISQTVPPTVPVSPNPSRLVAVMPYSKEQALEDLFLSEVQFDEMLNALREKKNIVLQGAPGVGKTYVARRLADAFIGARDPQRVQTIQFHQSYAYEDFVQGFRPTRQGHFELKQGLFYRFCRQAQQQESVGRAHVLIVDEINRGNLSKIFGELMMLVEPDKRGREFAIPLAYAESLDDTFYVPENLYLIGMMNTADRSLAMVDYALRRRFRFITLRPEFIGTRFKEWLLKADAPADLIEKIVSRMSALNHVIADDTKNLGPGYQIGHSYFCPVKRGAPLDEGWYRRVIQSEIVPLLHEYWFDDEQKVNDQKARLLA